MVRRKKKKRRRTAQRTRTAALPGWVWMCFGLAVGLSVAAAIYVSDRQLGSPLQTGSAPPAVPEKPAPAARVEEQETEPDPASRFDFYELLPKFEVVIPEEDLHAHPDVAARPVESPGVYVLQAGSFSGFADADRMKARLALLGIVSRIQKVSIDEKSYHRVRIGPIDSLDQLNAMRQSLREARIEVMVIQVAD